MGEPKRLIYDGGVYIRPVRRGIVLEDDPQQRHVDDWVADFVGVEWSDWTGRMRITVEVFE